MKIISKHHSFFPNKLIKGNITMEEKAKKKLQTEQFSQSISNFVARAEERNDKLYTLDQLSNTYKIQRRRIYDVLNVMEAIGACQRTVSDSIIWLGLDNVRSLLFKLQKENGVNQADNPIVMIVPNNVCISMGQLTQSLLLCFLSLQTKSLDIKQVSYFLSRTNNRYKTTLCKLYQITHILEAIGIISHKNKVGEVCINDSFFAVIPISHTVEIQGHSPYSIESLLNRPLSDTEGIVAQRRSDFMVAAKQNQFQQYFMYPIQPAAVKTS
ncbi:hypothetical protein TRFO_27756 [Tritrichomonas foetus]|uniref:E2F/DP family winged-helix DNA-binding domain-containing protein n=1 Tax=Tritrichomonas foetus TaxID=1144522 RepID=A0A1J4K5D1_9EUKA|nr:hypothetical protein TRFO_27756 [Tritrichomonas foetus]|eukprot:OHT04677.1 hypothetical protein TRFO_27756 [Tritrichomonas foetus]